QHTPWLALTSMHSKSVGQVPSANGLQNWLHSFSSPRIGHSPDTHSKSLVHGSPSSLDGGRRTHAPSSQVSSGLHDSSPLHGAPCCTWTVAVPCASRSLNARTSMLRMPSLMPPVPRNV